MAAALPADIAAALGYGPQTQQAIRRSSYLADALKQLQDQGRQPIQSYGELGAKLLATAILNRGQNKAQDATLAALKADQDRETNEAIAGLRGPAAFAPTPPPAITRPEPAPQTVPPPAPVQQAPLAPAQASYRPEDKDALTRMLVTEAIGEGPQGMAAAGHVALNRLKSGKFGGTLRDVIFAPRQFSGMAHAGQVRPEDYQVASQIAEGVLAGQIPDPTGGATHFLNPELTIQQQGHLPAWATTMGQGQRIGRHVFLGGNPQVAQNLPPPPAPPDPNGPPVQASQPFQVAGPITDVPSAPGSSPPAAGAPPAATPPQANAAGGMPQWPKYQPSPEEVAYVEGLLRDPRRHEEGLVEARKLQFKMTQPAEASIQLINGVPFYVSKVPGQGGAPVMIPVPREALTRQVDARTINPAATAGTQAQVDPLGNVKPGIGGPPENMQAVRDPNGQLRYVPVQGSKEDPYRVQPPAQNYQYQNGPNGLSVAPIQGSKDDPRNAMNVIAGAQQYRDMAKTIIDASQAVRKNFEAVRTGFAQQNGPGDVVIVNGLQRLIDEGVVRGEDVKTLAQSMGLQGTLDSWRQYATSGGRFDPAMRQKLYSIAEQLYRKADNIYRARLTGLQPGFDELYGAGSFSKFVFPQPLAEQLGWAGKPGAGPTDGPPAVAPPTFKPGTADAAIAEAIKRGLPLTPQQKQRAHDLGLIR